MVWGTRMKSQKETRTRKVKRGVKELEFWTEFPSYGHVVNPETLTILWYVVDNIVSLSSLRAIARDL